MVTVMPASANRAAKGGACLASPDDAGVELSQHEGTSFKEDRRSLAGTRCGRQAQAHDDHVVVVHCGSSLPACSAAMYVAYQSGQFSSR